MNSMKRFLTVLTVAANYSTPYTAHVILATYA